MVRIGWCRHGVNVVVSRLDQLSLVLVPWGRACFVMGNFSFFPFGHEAIARNEPAKQEDIESTSSAGMVGNIVWFLAGMWLAIGHVCSAVALTQL